MPVPVDEARAEPGTFGGKQLGSDPAAPSPHTGKNRRVERRTSCRAARAQDDVAGVARVEARANVPGGMSGAVKLGQWVKDIALPVRVIR